MANSILGMNNYYNLFTSPFSGSKSSPIENLMYGATASKIYSQTVAQSLKSNVSSFMTSLSKSAFDLKAATKPLANSGPDSSFTKKAVSSSDSNAVTGTATSNADSKAYTLNVSKLATSQTNTGNALTSTDKSAISSGTNSFTLQVGNSTKKISFTIDEKDTNQSGLNKMASAINFAKAGVTASVVTDSKTGTSSLKITSDKTGTGNEISLTDNSGNAASATGANAVSTEAQDAVYKLDGVQYTSKSNTISADNNKVQFTLKKAEGKDLQLSVGTDSKGIESDIKTLVKSYNSMIDTANSSNIAGAENLKADLEGIIKSKKGSLSNMGITQNDDGTLALDEKKLSSAVATNVSRVKETFDGYKGIADELYRKATEIQSSPLQYAQTTDPSNSFTGNSSNAFQSSSFRYRQNMFAGMVVDTLL